MICSNRDRFFWCGYLDNLGDNVAYRISRHIIRYLSRKVAFHRILFLSYRTVAFHNILFAILKYCICRISWHIFGAPYLMSYLTAYSSPKLSGMFDRKLSYFSTYCPVVHHIEYFHPIESNNCKNAIFYCNREWQLWNISIGSDNCEIFQ